MDKNCQNIRRKSSITGKSNLNTWKCLKINLKKFCNKIIKFGLKMIQFYLRTSIGKRHQPTALKKFMSSRWKNRKHAIKLLSKTTFILDLSLKKVSTKLLLDGRRMRSNLRKIQDITKWHKLQSFLRTLILCLVLSPKIIYLYHLNLRKKFCSNKNQKFWKFLRLSKKWRKIIFSKRSLLKSPSQVYQRCLKLYSNALPLKTISS